MKKDSTEGKLKKGENGQKLTPEQSLQTPEQLAVIEKEKAEKEEQLRTTIKKNLFVEIFFKNLGSVKATCLKVGIARETFYQWRKTDKEFMDRLRMLEKVKQEDVEEVANELILSRDGAMVRHWLDRRHPLYRPRVKVEGPSAGELSADDEAEAFHWVDDEEINKENHGDNTKGKNEQPEVHRDAVLHTGQARDAGAV